MKYMNNHYIGSRIFGKERSKMPMNLQFFAEGDGGGASGGTGDGAGTGSEKGGEAGTEGDKGAAASGSNLSFDELLKTPGYQSEFDRRVAKALETQKSKLQTDIQTQIENAKTEAQKLAKMNADEKAKYEAEKRESDLASRESEITKRELMATAKDDLANAHLPIELAEILNYADAESCKTSMEAVKKAFQAAVQAAVNDKLKGGNPPTETNGSTVYTMEQIKAMTPAEINKNWDAVQATMKKGL